MTDAVSVSLADSLFHIGQVLLAWLDEHAVNIIIILVISWFLKRFGSNLVARVAAKTVRSDLYPTKGDREKRVKTLASLSGAMVRTGVYVVAGMLIIGEINPGYTTALFASAGLVTVALGFGAKDLINDFMRGIFIITENQYRVGDEVVILGMAGITINGTVEAVTVRTTILRDLDGNVHHIPNGAVIVATNKTLGFSNLNEDIVVEAGTDLNLAEHLINHIGEELAAKAEFKNKIKQNPSFAGINGYEQGGISLKVTGTTTASDKYTVTSEFYRLLTKTFAKHDIKLAGAAPAPKK